eukprot:TRINITY_DN106740_c0_g1_i1.p1 TRINITY_DN106740_c0_g1~~TRINITY_DN106740_c0_g1_i1.p1  ORF type:complete len:119 (-),score=21.74 TRINITY_DN106740_c0_g1_i1:11-367(-)
MGNHASGREWIKRNVKTYGFPIVDKSLNTTNYHTVLQKAVQGPDGKNVAPAYYYMKGVLTRGLSDEMMSVLIQQKKKIPKEAPTCVIGLIQLGGVAKREIGRAVQQECRDRSRMPSSA